MMKKNYKRAFTIFFFVFFVSVLSVYDLNADSFDVVEAVDAVPVCAGNCLPANGDSVFLKRIGAFEKSVGLSWNVVADADGYYVYLNDALRDSTTGNSCVISNLEVNTTYTWKVVPFSRTLGTATGCATQQFKTVLPACVSYPAPVDYGSVCLNTIEGHSQAVLLSWDAVEGANGYHLYLNGNTTPVALTDIYYIWDSLSVGSSYTWKVLPTLYGTEQGSCSNTFHFTAIATTCASDLRPVDNDELFLDKYGDADNAAYLSWSAAENAAGYKVYTRVSGTGSYVEHDVSSNYFVFGDLTDNTTYQWYVIPYNARGSAAGCSNPQSFKVKQPASAPSCATLQTPANGADVSVRSYYVGTDTFKYAVKFDWQAVANANYTFKWGSSPARMNDSIVNITSNSFILTGVPEGTWYWTVIPSNRQGRASGCTIRNFTAVYSSVSAHLLRESTEGKDFFFSFLVNAYDGRESSENVYTAVISAKNNCSGTIHYYQDGTDESFTVTGGKTTTITLPKAKVYNSTLSGISSYVVHIVSDGDISLYVANEAYNSFDASIVLPTPALGTEYIVQTYPGPDSVNKTSSIGPCFIVTATEDSTVVTIQLPSGISTISPSQTLGTSWNVTLNKGQNYYVRGGKTTSNNDLSGTVVTSTKPVTVFNGNTIVAIGSLSQGYDHVFEQAFPVSYWGTEFAVTTSLGYDNSSVTYEPVRITTSEDDTRIYVNGGEVTGSPFAAKTTFQYDLSRNDTSCYITTSKPCAVYLYQPSGGGNSGTGDPSMVWMSPMSLSIDEITFSTFAANGIDTNQHYVNIVVSRAGVEGMRLIRGDNFINIEGIFTPLKGNADIMFGRKNLPTHTTYTLRNNDGIGFLPHVYGLAVPRGYAYSAGSSAIPYVAMFNVNGETIQPEVGGSVREFCLGTPIRFHIEANYEYEYDKVEWDFNDGTPIVTGDPVWHTFNDYADSLRITAVIYSTVVDEVPLSVKDTLNYLVFPFPEHVDTVRGEVCFGSEYSHYTAIEGVNTLVFTALPANHTATGQDTLIYTVPGEYARTIEGDYSEWGCREKITYILTVLDTLSGGIVAGVTESCTYNDGTNTMTINIYKLTSNTPAGKEAQGGGSEYGYQWQSSSSESGPFSDIAGAVAEYYYPVKDAVNDRYYRRAYYNDCSIEPVYSNVIMVAASTDADDPYNVLPGSTEDVSVTTCKGVNVNHPITFTTELPANVTPVYAWQKTTTLYDDSSWVNIGGATGESYTINEPISVTTYFRRKMTLPGCDDLVLYSLQVVEVKVIGTFEVPDPEVRRTSCGGLYSATFSVEGGVGSYSFGYNTNGGTSYTAISPSSINNFNYIFNNLSDNQHYYFKISDENGCVAYKDFTTGTYTALAFMYGTNQSGCPGAVVTISGTISGGDQPYTIMWEGSDALHIPDNGYFATTATPSVEVTVPNSPNSVYGVIAHVRDNGGCEIQKTNNNAVTVSDAPVVPTLTATPSGSCAGNGTITISPTGLYYSLTPDGTYTYGNTISNLKPGTYSVYVKNSSSATCYNTATTTVANTSMETITINGAATGDILCPNNNQEVTTTTTGLTSPVHYTWTGASANSSDSSKAVINVSECNVTKTVSVTATDANNCAVTEQITVNIKDKEAPEFSGTIANKTLTGSGCVYTLPDYTDEVRAIASDNCTSNTDLGIVQSPAAGTTVSTNTTVQFVVADLCGNSKKFYINVIIPALPVPVAVTPTEQTTGVNHGASIAVINPIADVVYTWAPATYLNTTTDDTVTATPTASGSINYVVTATDGNGCTSTASSLLNINIPGKATVTLTLDDNPLSGDTVVIKDCGTETVVATMTEGTPAGDYSASAVVSGSYCIYVNGKSTGKQIAVDIEGNGKDTVNFITIPTVTDAEYDENYHVGVDTTDTHYTVKGDKKGIDAGTYKDTLTLNDSGDLWYCTSCISYSGAAIDTVWKITKKALTVKADDQTKQYDGTATVGQGTDKMTITGLLGGQTPAATITNTNSAVNVGVYDTTLHVTGFSITTDRTGALTNVTANYAITYLTGKLTIGTGTNHWYWDTTGGDTVMISCGKVVQQNICFGGQPAPAIKHCTADTLFTSQPRFGTADTLYFDNGHNTIAKPSAAGSYYVTMQVAGTANYDEIVTDTAAFVIYPQFTGDTIAKVCQTFTWHGITYTSTPATAPTHTYKNIYGCDSIVTLHLTIDPLLTATTAAVPPAGGTTSGDGTYCLDSLVTLKATVNNGYKFADWTDNDGNVISGDSIYTFSIKTDTLLKANFIPGTSTVTLTLDDNPLSGNTVVIKDCGTETVVATMTEGTPAGDYSASAVVSGSYCIYVNGKSTGKQIVVDIEGNGKDTVNFITIPTVTDAEYDETYHVGVDTTDTHYTVKGDKKGIDAGTYKDTLTLNDSGDLWYCTSCISYSGAAIDTVWKITKKALTVKADDQTKQYDGTATVGQGTDKMTITGLLGGQTPAATITNTNSAVNVGVYDTTLHVTGFSITTDRAGTPTDVTTNYAITYLTGKLTIGTGTNHWYWDTTGGDTVMISCGKVVQQNMCFGGQPAPAIKHCTADTLFTSQPRFGTADTLYFDNGHNTIAKPSAAGSYYVTMQVTGTANYDEIVTDTAAFVIYEIFNSGDITSSGDTICIGTAAESIPNTAASGGFGTYHYQWFMDGITIAGATSQDYTPTDITTVGTAVYTRQAADEQCNTALTLSTGSYILKVMDVPAVTTDIMPLTIAHGDTLPLVVPTVVNNGSAIQSAGWQLSQNEDFLPSESYTMGDTLDYTHDNWYLRYYAQNECGTTYSNVVQIKVIGTPKVAALIIPDGICHGNVLGLTVPAVDFRGQTAMSQGWQLSADNFATASFTEYAGQQLTDSFDGWYLRYYAQNGTGYGYSDTVQIAVHSLPVVTIVGDTDIFYTEQVMLTAGGGASYQWNTGALTAAMAVMPADTGAFSYGVTVTTAAGCVDSARQTVHVRACGNIINLKDVDDNFYSTHAYNHLCWMTENLTVTHYADGSDIPGALVYQCTGCPDTNTILDVFGRLYTWNDILHGGSDSTLCACPEGWRLPSLQEYMDLLLLTGYDMRDIKSTDYWIELPGNNSSLFNLLPGGYYDSAIDRFNNLFGNAYMMTSTSITYTTDEAYSASFGCDDGFSQTVSRSDAISVRCVKQR